MNASTYSVIKSALVARLQQRPALSAVNVLTYIPVNKDDIRTDVGTYECIAMAEAEGTFDDVVFTDGALIFDETLMQTVLIEVHGRDSSDSQAAVDQRVNELLYETLADIASQRGWDRASLGFDVFDYCYFTPAVQRWSPGRLQQSGVFAAAVEIGLQVQARRSFP